MSEELKDLGELVKEGDELALTAGGEAGGDGPKLFLKRSELAVLRRFMDRNCITPNEARDSVACVMDIVHNAKSKRLKLAAVNTLVALDRNNLKEVAIYIGSKKVAHEVSKPGGQSGGNNVNVNVQIVEQVVVKKEEPLQITETIIENINGRNGHKNGSNLP